MGLSQSTQSSADGGAVQIDAQLSTSSTNSDNSSEMVLNGGSTILTQEQKHSLYTPPTTPIKPLAHYIFMVHGIYGNDLEMGYLATAIQNLIAPQKNGNEFSLQNDNSIPDAKRTKRSSSRLTQHTLPEEQRHAVTSTEGGLEESNEQNMIIHSVKCNVGKTTDGIRKGGYRLAKEMVDFIRTDVQKRITNGGDKKNDGDQEHNVTYSIVGNSLGGLYARYAISLLPYQLQLFQQHNPSSSSPSVTLNLHPNIFCTTATPHLGVSRHTYLPIPRVAETVVGLGMGTTGRDLFRLNSEKDLASNAAEGVVNAAMGGVRRLSALRPKVEGEVDDTNITETMGIDEEEMECIIHNMCLQDKYLLPLRNFRHRIAYANAYGTDFQVPCETAAFLNEKSGVGHFVIASRDFPSAKEKQVGEGESAEKREHQEDTSEKEQGVPPFIVAVVRTEKTSQPQSPRKPTADDTPADELLRMSQSLDALGWTKVFIDVRDRIPVPGWARPSWLRTPHGTLDDLIRERADLTFASLSKSADSNGGGSAATSKDKPEPTSECILTSQELAQSTKLLTGESMHFPMGHTVMIANAKSDRYSQLNSQGRPVMDKLAGDLISQILKFD